VDSAATIARWRVPLGFVSGALVIWLARPTMRTLVVGLAIAVIGEAIRIWAAGHLEKGREVTRSGPYRLMRHPLYAGSAVIGLGAVVAAAHWGAAIVIATYLGATLIAAMRAEEAGMRAAFGDQYEAYVESRAQPLERRFSVSRAIRNREHRAMLGLVVMAALLAAKAGFGSR
jgi:protein-S-isoprenylcysteine O-methyltransferase Ste14